MAGELVKHCYNHIKTSIELAGHKSLFGFIFSWEAGKMFVDGAAAQGVLLKGPSGTLVGTDVHGNKYFENDNLAYGRKRWVVYADHFDYSPSTVPAEWHGWLNYINDFKPTKYDFKKPIYHVESFQTPTGKMHGTDPHTYAPKGAWTHGSLQRNWRKYEAWQPPTSN